MDTLLLTKRQFLVFVSLVTVFTMPFLLLTAAGHIKNEGALILYLPFLAGMPWVLLYALLPGIPGFTSAGVPDQSGDLTVSVLQLVFLMLPAWLNIYIVVRLLSGGRRRA